MTLNRRRFLSMTAAAAGAALASPADAAPQIVWRGVAMGAAASLCLVGLSRDRAVPVLGAVESELRRLEGIFSLYRPGSALSRLNRDGRLVAPPPDLLAVLSLADRLFRASGGAFDPTVQPIFATHADALMAGRAPTGSELAAARALTGWSAVRLGADRITLERPGAAITLNGIAQGYITDRIAALLTGFGLHDVLVDMGEIRSRGRNPSGRAWSAGIREPSGRIVNRVTLGDGALASSAPLAMSLGEAGHIFDPLTGATANAVSMVSVAAPDAALADGLSTALCAIAPPDRPALLRGFPAAAIVHLA